jgi:hypothetical protein
MKRLIVVAATVAALLSLGAGQAVAGNHSGPEAYTKGTGSVTAQNSTATAITGCNGAVFLPGIGLVCTSFGPVGQDRTTTNTSEDFDFSAKAGPQTLTPLDPTNGPFGTMRLSFHETSSMDRIVFGNCIPNALGSVPCPSPSHTDLPGRNADVTAEVTCLQVVNNTAAIGGHVIKFSGDFPPTRGLLFNGVDNTVAGQQVGFDLFDSAFLADAPQECPVASGGHPITSGDVYVDQS